MTMCKMLQFKSASLIGIILASVVLSLSFGNVVTVSSAENIVNGLNSSIVNEDTDANSSVGADGEELLSPILKSAIVLLLFLLVAWFAEKERKYKKKLDKEMKAKIELGATAATALLEYNQTVGTWLDELVELEEKDWRANRHEEWMMFDLCLKTENNYSIITGKIGLPEMTKGETISFSAMDGKNILRGDESRDFWIPCKEFSATQQGDEMHRKISKKLTIANPYSQDSLSRLYDLTSAPSELLKIRCEENIEFLPVKDDEIIQQLTVEDEENTHYIPYLPFAFTSIGCKEPTHFICKYGGDEIPIPIVFDEYVKPKDVDEARYNWVQGKFLVHPKQQATANLIFKLEEYIEEHVSKITYIGPDDGANLFTSLFAASDLKIISHLNIVAADASMGRDSNDIRTTSHWEKILWFLFGENRIRDGPQPTTAGFTHSNPEWHKETKSHLIIDTYTLPWWPDILSGLENRMAHLTNEGVLILVLPKDVSREPFGGAGQDKVDELLDLLKKCPVHENLDNVLGYAILKKHWDSIRPEESKEKTKSKKPDLPTDDSTNVTQNFNAPVKNVAGRDIAISGAKKNKPFNPFERGAASKRKKSVRRRKG